MPKHRCTNIVAVEGSTESIGVLFALRSTTLAAGGDGDGWLISPTYREWAELFARYEGALVRPLFTQRRETESAITFSHDEESIRFTDVRPMSAGVGAWDIVIEVP